MKKIKILYIHANNYDIGGADYCLYKMVKEVKKNGIEPIVLLRKNTDIIKLYRQNNIKVILKPIIRFQKTKNPFMLFLYIMRLSYSILIINKIIKNEKINIVHSNDLLDFSGSIAGKINKIKTIQHIRMILPDSILKTIIVYIVKQFNDIILCVSKGVKSNMFLNTNNANILYDWIDMEGVGHNLLKTNLRKELNIPLEIKLVGSIGRLEEWKGQHIFIEAANIVIKKYPQCYFLIVGGIVKKKEKYKELLTRLVKKYNLSSNVFFLGERKDIAAIMQQLDIMVHSSISPDPFPGVVLEALYNGTPVIGANSGGVPEQIDDNITGLLYEPGNKYDLAKKILQLLQNDKLRNEMASKSKKIIMDKLDKNKILENLIDFYQI